MPSSVVTQLATLLLGLLTGAMLLIGVALVPYWRSLEPLEFSRWFGAHASLIGRLMIPLGILATLSVVLAAALARSRGSAGWPWLAAAAVAALFVAAVYPLYFTGANAALGSGTLAAGEVTAELARWRSWHWGRTLAGGLAFVAAIRACSLRTGAPARRTAALVAAALGALDAHAASAHMPSIAPAAEPAWYRGLQLQVTTHEGWSWLLWPHELVNTPHSQFVTREQVDALAPEDGGYTWTVRRLAPDGLEMSVRVRPLEDGLLATYEVTNGSSSPLLVTIGPCLQLPPGFMASVSDARRADHVAVPTAEKGWQWISATTRTPGTARLLDPVQPKPWTQHYLSGRGHDHATMPHSGNPGLDLFGVAQEHVVAGAIVAAQPGGPAVVAVATDREAGVAYALLNCLHAVIQLAVPAGGRESARYLVVFHRGSFADLTARLEGTLGLESLPDVAPPHWPGGAR